MNNLEFKEKLRFEMFANLNDQNNFLWIVLMVLVIFIIILSMFSFKKNVIPNPASIIQNNIIKNLFFLFILYSLFILYL